MKRHTLLTVLPLFWLPAWPADERLDEVLAALKAAGDRLSTLSARFDQTHHDHILNEDESSTGRLFLQVPGRIRWEYDSPYPKVLLVKDDKVRLFNPAANQVQEFEKGQMKGAGADLLIGFGKSNAEISKNYHVKLIEENQVTVVLELLPKPDSAASVFQAIEMTLDKKKWIPLRSVFHEPNRDVTTIVFKDVEVNRSLSDEVFELDLPPHVEVVRGG